MPYGVRVMRQTEGTTMSEEGDVPLLAATPQSFLCKTCPVASYKFCPLSSVFRVSSHGSHRIPSKLATGVTEQRKKSSIQWKTLLSHSEIEQILPLIFMDIYSRRYSELGTPCFNVYT